jgi:hypothetical protein
MRSSTVLIPPPQLVFPGPSIALKFKMVYEGMTNCPSFKMSLKVKQISTLGNIISKISHLAN